MKEKWIEGSLLTEYDLASDEGRRFKEKQFAARALVERGYGFPKIKEQLALSNSSIQMYLFLYYRDANKYKAVSCSMITDIYRKIE